MKLGQTVCLDVILDEFENGSKTRSLGQILEKHSSFMLYHTISKAQVSDSRVIMALLLKNSSQNFDLPRNMALVNGGFLHCTDIKKFFSETAGQILK